jgi:hypothetical protein
VLILLLLLLLLVLLLWLWLCLCLWLPWLSQSSSLLSHLTARLRQVVLPLSSQSRRI